MPKISIVMPNLNNAQYLAARFDSILCQTHVDWELLVLDAFSADGAWTIIDTYLRMDSRIHAWQGPRKGVYAAINECIAMSSGEYIYIATSDDTMEPTCLQDLSEALDAYPECELAHCSLTWIDKNGEAMDPNPWNYSLPSTYFGSLMRSYHIRMMPHDGYLHYFLHTVYMSLTQLMIKRSAFEKTGPFPSAYGPAGDFSWGMKAAMVCNTIHVPRYLATWRRHPDQMTVDESDAVSLLDRYTTLLAMADDAVRISTTPECHELFPKLNSRDLRRPYLATMCSLISKSRHDAYRIAKLIALARLDPYILRLCFLHTAYPGYSKPIDFIGCARQYMDSHGLNHLIKIC